MIKKHILKTKRAFTMLELIMVIVILGIVSSIGSSVIANIYENYLLQRATHRASLKTELAAQQIANLLSYRVPGTTLARDPAALDDNLLVTDPTAANDDTHTLLEWIGTDNDGFSAGTRPPWNGFCDVDPSTQTAIKTPGSRLLTSTTSAASAHGIISNLSNSGVSLTGPQYPAIFFRADQYAYNSTTSAETLYEVLRADGTGCMGIVSTDVSCISSVGSSDDETLSFQTMGSASQKVISEHYKLAWTAYAIRPVPRDAGHYDLELYYNYQPWHGERHTAPANYVGEHATIITNVTVFKFAESGNTLRFKLCAQESIGGDFNITICKEKAIIL